MSRPKLMLQLVYSVPQPWDDGPPPLSVKRSACVTIPWDWYYNSNEKSFEELIASSLRKAIARNPKLIDVVAKLLAEKVKEKKDAEG